MRKKELRTRVQRRPVAEKVASLLNGRHFLGVLLKEVGSTGCTVITKRPK